MDPDPDVVLMEQLRNGDRAAAAALFERHHLALFRYFLHLTARQPWSEDLVQEVFIRVLKYGHTYDAGQPFRVWLFQVARNTFLDSARKKRRDAPLTDWAVDGTEFRSHEPMPEERMARKQDEERLRSALAKLPAAKREVLILSRFHGMRYEEIGQVLGCEAGAVKVRVYRALRDLRELFFDLQKEKV